MAKWRIEPHPDGRRWWLMSGTNTLGVINGRGAARQIVRDHNDLEDATATFNLMIEQESNTNV